MIHMIISFEDCKHLRYLRHFNNLGQGSVQPSARVEKEQSQKWVNLINIMIYLSDEGLNIIASHDSDSYRIVIRGRL